MDNERDFEFTDADTQSASGLASDELYLERSIERMKHKPASRTEMWEDVQDRMTRPGTSYPNADPTLTIFYEPDQGDGK